MKQKAGFTLIELLVVIAIIALLLSIILPGMNLIKRKALGVVCQSNLGQLSMSWFLYSEDNNSNLVQGNVYDGLHRWVEGPQDESGNYTGSDLDGVDDVTTQQQELMVKHEKIGIERGQLYPYIEEVKI